MSTEAREKGRYRRRRVAVRDYGEVMSSALAKRAERNNTHTTKARKRGRSHEEAQFFLKR
jgi:hypothetical protein